MPVYSVADVSLGKLGKVMRVNSWKIRKMSEKFAFGSVVIVNISEVFCEDSGMETLKYLGSTV